MCDVITHVKLLHTSCYHTKICSADIYLVENHNNNLYLFMVPMTPFRGSWLMDYWGRRIFMLHFQNHCDNKKLFHFIADTFRGLHGQCWSVFRSSPWLQTYRMLDPLYYTLIRPLSRNNFVSWKAHENTVGLIMLVVAGNRRHRVTTQFNRDKQWQRDDFWYVLESELISHT